MQSIFADCDTVISLAYIETWSSKLHSTFSWHCRLQCVPWRVTVTVLLVLVVTSWQWWAKV